MPNINKILALPCNNASSRFGASMGRCSQKEGNPERLHLQRMRFVDQCYDVGGAYWGMPENVYCAFSADNTENESPIRVFVRGKDREDAKKNVLEALGSAGWTFLR